MILCDFECPKHGVFEAVADADAESHPCPQPTGVTIPITADYERDSTVELCGLSSPWSPTPVMGRVKRWEVVRGGWEKPERKTFLDTRDLGEGQDPDEFRAKRSVIWEEQRHREIKELG